MVFAAFSTLALLREARHERRSNDGKKGARNGGIEKRPDGSGRFVFVQILLRFFENFERVVRSGRETDRNANAVAVYEIGLLRVFQ